MVKGATGAVIDATLIVSQQSVLIRLSRWRWMPKVRPFSLRMAVNRELPVGGRARRLCAWSSHRPCEPERNDAFRSGHRWCAHLGESGVCGQGSGSQCQSTVSETTQNQEHNHASSVQEQTALGTPATPER